MIFNPDSEFMKIADRSTKNWQRMRSHARAGSNLGLNIKKPDTENGKVIIFNGIDGVRKVARAMLTSDTKHINLSGLAMSPAQSPFSFFAEELAHVLGKAGHDCAYTKTHGLLWAIQKSGLHALGRC